MPYSSISRNRIMLLDPQVSDLYPRADADGTIAWHQAIQYVWNEDQGLNFLAQFAQDYGHLAGERIDLGELEAWYSEHAIEAIADLVFG
jgi:hypothetical protein